MPPSRPGTRVFTYDSYSTGRYGPRKAGGVTIQFTDIETGEALYCVFNVSVTRDRTTRHGKAGSPLPRGHFKPPAKGEFLKFWRRCGLEIPDKLSKFHRQLGKLKGVTLTGEIERGDKLAKASIKALEHCPNNAPRLPQDCPKAAPTTCPNEVEQAQLLRAFDEYSTTGANSCGKTLTGGAVKRRSGWGGLLDWARAEIHREEPEPDEWLLDYQEAKTL